MGYPGLTTIINAVKNLTYIDNGQTLLRSRGLWHVFIFLRHRRLNGLKNSYEFNSFDLSEACFDIMGIYLPIDKDSRNSYYEPAAAQGVTPAALFRHREGPRQTFLNRIYTGLTGDGPNQPKLFTASDRKLPVTINLGTEWITELRSHDGNKLILDSRIQDLIVWMFRFGVPNEREKSSSIGIHLGSGQMQQRDNLVLKPIPTSIEKIKDEIADFLGLTVNQMLELFPSFETVDPTVFKEETPITFDLLKNEMERVFLTGSSEEVTTDESDNQRSYSEINNDYSLSDDNPYFIKVKKLIEDGFAGVIFTGPPGTSKSWYASRIALRLVNNDKSRIRFIQFHGSYQYEDFVEGFIPVDGGGFRLVPKHLVEMCSTAENAKGELCVLVIDELSRSDPARVFGEALTYIEREKRGMTFYLASGKPFSIPSNLVFLATMNPLDRGVDEVDAALERRFAKIAMNPDIDLLRQGLQKSQLQEELKEKVVKFFSFIQTKKEIYRIGHAYFLNVKDEEGLNRLWENQLYFYFKKAFGLNEEGYQEIERYWQKLFLKINPPEG